MRHVPLPASRAGRSLIAFWAVSLLAAAALAGTLQWLGPPPHAAARMAMEFGAPKFAAALVPAVRPAPRPAAALPAPALPAGPAGIAPPNAALLEPAPHYAGALLPRISHDGRDAQHVYAARVPVVPPGSKRIAILLDGVGLSAADSLDAIDQLPAAVSLAVSPYATEPGAVLDSARRAGHELLLSLPMEPARSPLDDEGAKALTEQVDIDENTQRLEWSLSRIQGYAGITNAAAGLGGERFVASPPFIPITRLLAQRGLFYLDATPGTAAPAGIAGLAADLRLDDPPDAASIDRQLGRLEQIALRNGSAIGVAGPLYPVTIRRLADWTHALASRGLVLVPVSSLVHPADKTLQEGAAQRSPP